MSAIRSLLVLFVVLFLAVPQPALPATAVRLAVLEFAPDADTPQDWHALGKGFQEMILVDLSKAGAVEVLERRAVRETRLAMGLAPPGPAAGRRDLGRKAGATHVLSGTFSVRGDSLVLGTELLDVASGELVLERRVEGATEAFFEAEQEVVQASIGALSLSLSPRERAETRRLHTADLLAFKDFSQGLEAFDAERYEASLRSLRSAAERDAQFSLAAITLEQYTALIDQLRARADAIEVVRAEQERLEELAEAGADVEVLRKLLDIARREGPRHQRERLAALHTLALAYGNDARGQTLSEMRRREDRFAMQRAADELWRQYHEEAMPLWPQLPVRPAQTFWAGFPAPETFEKDFARSVERLWEHGADYPENRRRYLQDNLRYPHYLAARLHLSLAEQVRLHDRFMEMAEVLPPSEYHVQRQNEERVKLYRKVLRFDDSTRLVEAEARTTENEHKLRSLAMEVEENKTWTEVLRGAKDRARIEEWLFLAQDDWSKTPIWKQGRDHFMGRGPLDEEGAQLLTRMRKWPHGDRAWVRIGATPAWCHQHCYWVWTGPRSDLRVAESVRFYKEPDREPASEPVLYLDSVARSDLEAAFTVRWSIPEDFRPGREAAVPDEAAEVELLFGLVDLDNELFRDPVTDERRLTRPLTGLGVRITREAVILERVTEVERESYDRKRLGQEELARAKVRRGVADGARVGVRVSGARVRITLDGRELLDETLEAPPVGFAGLRMRGLGFVEVGALELTGSEAGR